MESSQKDGYNLTIYRTNKQRSWTNLGWPQYGAAQQIDCGVKFPDDSTFLD